MEKLIAALEAATESSFELNAAIARLDFYREAHGDLADNEVPDFCASIDAALTLVPANHDWSLHADNGEAIAGCMPSSEDGCDIADCRGATPALALCIAALQARATISSKEQVKA
jgi:hypothetical protein